MRRDILMQEKMKHAEEEAAAKAAAEQAALAAARRKAYQISQERRRQFLESAAEPLLGASRSLRSTTSGVSLPCLSQVCCCSMPPVQQPDFICMGHPNLACTWDDLEQAIPSLP